MRLRIIKLLLKSLYKFNEETDDFDKYFETVSDDIYYILNK